MEALEKKAAEILSSSESDLHLAADELLQFTNDFSNDRQLKKSALKLNWDIENATNDKTVPTPIDKFQTQIQRIVASVRENFTSEPEAVRAYFDGRVSARDVIISDAPPEIVFKGEQLSYQYGKGEFLLKPFDLEMSLGEITAVVGENSSGKSTLIKIVAGALASSSGTSQYPLFTDKTPINWSLIKEHIAYIPQRIHSWPGIVKDNLMFTASLKGLRGKENADEVNYYMHRLNLTEFQESNWNSLSGGAQMRMELARALIWKPKLLILDEPLANLDINTLETFLQDLRHIASSYKDPISVLITSQHLYEVEGISDKLLYLSKGKVDYNGRTKDQGIDRTLNSFELGCDDDINTLRVLLTKHGITDLSVHGRNFFIRTDLKIESNQLLTILLEAGINIIYFRDVSCSSRVRFHE
ncbi:MAG: ABC transporter ATP-binding protein [Agarilytica sp.]